MNLYYYFFVFILISLQNGRSDMKTFRKGPYKTTVTELKPCIKTTLPRPKPDFGPVDTFSMEIYNTTKKPNLLRGNFTLYQPGSGFSIRSNAYIWQGGRWKLHVTMPNLDCSSPLITFLLTLTDFQYNATACSFHKGVYHFSDVDLNGVEHLWSSEREYGRVLWRTEMLSQYNTLLCSVVETVVEPLQKATQKKNTTVKLLAMK